MDACYKKEVQTSEFFYSFIINCERNCIDHNNPNKDLYFGPKAEYEKCVSQVSMCPAVRDDDCESD